MQEALKKCGRLLSASNKVGAPDGGAPLCLRPARNKRIPLLHAVLHAPVTVLALLLDAQDVAGTEDVTAMHLLALRGRQQYNAMASITFRDGVPRSWAEAAMWLLLQAGGVVNGTCDAGSLLHCAAEAGTERMVLDLLHAGACPLLPPCPDSNASTCLAGVSGNTGHAMNAGATCGARKDGMRPTHTVIHHSRLHGPEASCAILKHLLDAAPSVGHHLTTQENEFSLATRFAADGLAVLQLLLCAGQRSCTAADVQQAVCCQDVQGNTPLHNVCRHAASHGDSATAMCELLLDAGADPAIRVRSPLLLLASGSVICLSKHWHLAGHPGVWLGPGCRTKMGSCLSMWQPRAHSRQLCACWSTVAQASALRRTWWTTPGQRRSTFWRETAAPTPRLQTGWQRKLRYC